MTSAPNARTAFLPACFAVYKASSAARTSSLRSTPGLGYVATPADAPIAIRASTSFLPIRSTTSLATARLSAWPSPGRSSANSSPPRRYPLAAVPKARADSLQNAVPGRMTEPVVDPLEVVEVEQTERHRTARLRPYELPLELLLEAPFVAEARERIGKGELHRRERVSNRALV